MTNYIEELKKYWQSNDLKFIASLKIINNTQGYFNHFINPKSKIRLSYPIFDDIDIVDKRISFSYHKVSELVDGNYYKVELEHTNNPKGKNNPYSLKIKNISTLNQDKVKKLLEERKKNDSESTIFYGSYHQTNDVFASFENVMYSESGKILMSGGESQKVFVSPNISLKEGVCYSFSIKKNNGKLPNAILNTIEELKLNPYKDYIRLRFERLNNPEANKMIANLMREIGKGMYSSKQRMIFELLQNADDAPGKEKVEFHIDINGDYFFVMHDGAPFNKDDIEAITSAAESTKRGDNKKTGYKGIGFKSVFTDSTEVWLKSGGYQFAFVRNSPLFDNFDKFYFSSKRYTIYPELLKEDKLKFRNQRLRFNGATDIPWQVIPIWQDHLPTEFTKSNFNNFNNPVQFALKLGKNNIEEYKSAIDSITKRPQFLLFLRNTSKFNARRNGVMVLRKDTDDIIEILRLKGEEESIYLYTKQIFENIEVSDEAFSELNIGLKKQSKINDYNEVSYYFTDLAGNQIETIPPKLASATTTEIAFGISLDNNKISSEKDYINDLSKYSSLFTYLPMEDTRFQLPFLVNADFVPSSDRQSIQGDNLWNTYIMIRVAEKHVTTLSNYASKFLDDNDKFSSYLSLLLKELIPEDETAQIIIDSYNEKYLDQLEKQKIIVNDDDELQLISSTIIDETGTAELLGNDTFYEIFNTGKHLPHQKIDIFALKSQDYIKIEEVSFKELVPKIDLQQCKFIGEMIGLLNSYETPELLSWLDKIASINAEVFENIQFIKYNNKPYSIKELLCEPKIWLIVENTQQYEGLLKELGFHTVSINLDEYTNIKEYLREFFGYINDKTLTYERISNSKYLSSLKISDKLNLIDFFQNSEFMRGIGEKKYFEELRLFIDEKGNPRPLRHLISKQEEISVSSIQQFRISDNEFRNFPEILKKELIAKEQIFTSFILNEDLFETWSQQFDAENINTYVDDLKSSYAWVENKDSISSAEWASIPWLFVGNDLRFLMADKVYWSTVFNNMQSENYETIKSTLHRAELKTLPLKECGVLVEEFELKTDNVLISDWTVIKNLDTISANILLDWIEDDGTYNSFFEDYTFSHSLESKWSIISLADVQIFDGSEISIKEYMDSIPLLKTKFVELNEVLCSENRNKIGLLQGDKLLKAIIESKSYNQNLATLLPQNLSWKFFDSFISNLSVFNLETDKEYNSITPEHIILSLIIKRVEDINTISEDIQKTIDCIRSKIFINQNPLNFYDLSDRIQFGKGDDKKILKLSDVLEEFKGESDVLDDLIESFVAIKEKAKLRKIIFKTRIMHYDIICSKIEAETSAFYSVHQMVFQLLYKKYLGQRKWIKQSFDVYWINQGNDFQLQTSYKLFLDVIFDLDYSDLSDFYFSDLDFKNLVNKNQAIDSELLPQWLVEWLNIAQENRFAFISKLGYNGINSPIVKLREAVISEEYDQNTVIRFFEEAKPNSQIIWNTIHWLSSYSSEIVTRNIVLIEQINDYVNLNNTNLNAVTIPIIEYINKDNFRNYKLQKISVNSKLYFISLEEGFAHSIFNTLKKESDDALFIDSRCGKKSSHFNKEIIQLKEIIDDAQLVQNSKLWDEPFYKRWEYYEECRIYIYNGKDLPYKRLFNDITINTFTEGLIKEYSGGYYLSNILQNSILTHQPPIIPMDKLQSLKDWRLQVLEDPTLLDENPFEESYNETFDRMIQDRYGISKQNQNAENSNAKRQVLYFLVEEGFNVDFGNSQNNYSALYNIIDPDGNKVNCIVRSAKAGLLYLDKEHWNMLESNQTYLVVIYPGNKPRLFKDRLELLEGETSENVLFRVPNNKHTSEIDGVFDALESESHLILVTSEKMRESLFPKLNNKGNFYQEKDVAIGDDNFSL